MNACECNGKGDDMRLRNIPRAEGVLQAHPIVIKEENSQKGKWNQIFGNDHPIYIESGMGKGQFLMTQRRFRILMISVLNGIPVCDCVLWKNTKNSVEGTLCRARKEWNCRS